MKMHLQRAKTKEFEKELLPSKYMPSTSFCRVMTIDLNDLSSLDLSIFKYTHKQAHKRTHTRIHT